MISKSFPKTFNITVLFKCLILLLIFTTPVLSAISSSVYDEGISSDVLYSKTASTVANSRTSRAALSVSLVIVDTTYVGDKITFLLRATASGGTGSYNFSWSGAYPDHQSSPTTNPNYARRTILSTQTVTVSVTVTSGAETVTKYKKLIDF